MGAYGYADGQAITGWLGVPLVEQTALAIGAGTQDFGPFPLTNFASVIVAVHPTGGQVTVTVKQTIGGGPASLELDETFVVPAGATAFEAIVLFADTVTVELVGGAVGTTVDFAVYPSNTTTNAQVITQATINVQHNDALVAAEPTLDFEDNGNFVWTVADDAPNTRVKITPPAIGWVKLAEIVLGAPAALLDFTGIPAIYRHLWIIGQARGTSALGINTMGLRLNNDAGGNYDFQTQDDSAAAMSTTPTFAATAARVGYMADSSAAAGLAGVFDCMITNYRGGVLNVQYQARTHAKDGTASGQITNEKIGGSWRNSTAVNRVTVLPGSLLFDTGTMVTLLAA